MINKKFNRKVYNFMKQNKEKTIEVLVNETSVWFSQKLIAELFNTIRQNIGAHLFTIFEQELIKIQYARNSCKLSKILKTIIQNIII